ncbi:MAG: hypothetical protein ACOX0F_06725 [Syntrophomonadaceae bacterium]|jgi:ribonuclease BN (tRNA processing enzyme)
MEMQVVGCWAPYPKTGQACSGYLIRQGQTTCLADCGHGVLDTGMVTVIIEMGQDVHIVSVETVAYPELGP